MWINGLTIDNPWNADKIIKIVKTFPKRPTLRIVFDEVVSAKQYLPVIQKLSPVADIMGELLDSYYVKDVTLAEYVKRAEEYLKILGSHVSIWEVGNEINGDWLDGKAAAKAYGAWEVFYKAGKKTALTGYYNNQCEDNNGPMLKWLSTHLNPVMASRLDYFLVSYYEDDCEARIVQLPEWNQLFLACGNLFPKALLGIGECGTKRKARKVECMNRYYGLTVNHTRYVGGNFWWYGWQDVIYGTTLRETFKGLMR